MFDIVAVNSSLADAPEQLGTKPKFWYRDGNRRMLFKEENRGTGEDWAEKLACEFCRLLGLPHAHYELAHDEARNVPGVVSENFVPAGAELVLGNQILMARDPAYPGTRRYAVSEHGIGFVSQAIGELSMPEPSLETPLPEGVSTPLGVFAGYILLDTWIANQDRHHENWGAIRRGSSLALAPTFDHASSMARNLPDDRRRVILTTRDTGQQMPAFARRAKSAFYSDTNPPRKLSTMEAWKQFSSKVPRARSVWLQQLGKIGEPEIRACLDKIPAHRMSSICQDFTMKLLIENRKRLIEGED
ncbi:MAG: hypothetical protein PWP23_2794 [Candidatus Sumerlaeota bacterium]|nr:hypothetical protein [Candidatus Sumerlaeota bacterium]